MFIFNFSLARSRIASDRLAINLKYHVPDSPYGEPGVCLDARLRPLTIIKKLPLIVA
jgi:hypothetical protein